VEPARWTVVVGCRHDPMPRFDDGVAVDFSTETRTGPVQSEALPTADAAQRADDVPTRYRFRPRRRASSVVTRPSVSFVPKQPTGDFTRCSPSDPDRYDARRSALPGRQISQTSGWSVTLGLDREGVS
jgi:hypothetical protein